jgi:hypothetical protein
MANISDPVENVVADGLRAAGIPFVHESENKVQGLDFFLPDQLVMIECKRFWSERASEQIRPHGEVILIQGMAAARAFSAMIARA